MADRKPTALIVEDDVDLRELIAEFLNEEYRTVMAGTADEGVAGARSSQPSIILCDLNMPGKNGLHTIREVRNDPALANVPIILISGQAQPPESRQLRVTFLPKPFGMSKLMETIDRTVALMTGTPSAARG